MSRVWTLTRFCIRDLSRSLSGIAPVAAALAFGIIAFEYGMDQAQFITVGGVGIGTIGWLTALLLAGRANRAASVPLLARLERRSELLAALVVSSLLITTVLAALITLANLLAGRLTLDGPSSALWILPTWLVLWLLGFTLALPLSALVSRGGLNLVGYLLVTGLLVAGDRKALLSERGLDWLVRLVTAVLWPVSTLLSQASAGMHDRLYLLAAALCLVSAALLFALAAELFAGKDLVWAE